ncbi:MAG TPA: tautomerase family protein [Coleofasciculaceae cyanobacterium]
MVQIKFYGNAEFLKASRQIISDVVHACVVKAIALPPEKRFHRFFPLTPEDFIYPDDRSERYLILEISMFEGRSVDAKRQMIHLLFEQLSSQVGIDPLDVEITITETPRHNWGIRGQAGDELQLNYAVVSENSPK